MRIRYELCVTNRSPTCGEREETYVWLGRTKLELDQCDLGLFHASRATGALGACLGQHKSVNQLGVVDSASDLFHKTNILQVDIVGNGGVDDANDGVNSDGGQK